MTETTPRVGIIMGSESDLPVMEAAAAVLDELSVPYELTIVSAHRTPDRMYEYAKTSTTYDSWKYKDVLDGRLANIEANHENFSRPIAEQDPKFHPVAERSCVVCHQE